MIRRSIHSITAPTGTRTALDMRLGLAWDGSACFGLEQLNYQPKQRGLNRAGKPD